MLGEIEMLEIQLLYRQGNSLKSIARDTGYSINTVRRYIRDNKQPTYSARPLKPKKLDNFINHLTNRVKQASPNWIPATVLFGEIKAIGYVGGITLVRDYLCTLKPKIKEYPLIRFETAPGEQMQVDFAHFKHIDWVFYVFVAILGYSRMLYAEFVEDQKIDTVIRCHEHAFEYFAGVPKNCLYDNMKTIIITRNAYGPGNHKLNANFYDFAKHYCFIPRVCKPYRPQTKGKIERMVSYLRHSFYTPFVAGRQDLNLDELNIGVMSWLNDVANMRVHATTKSIPKERWVIEKTHLLNIPNSYCDNYGVTNKNPITQQNNNIMDQNTHSLQHSLSIYDSLLPLAPGGAL